MTPKKLEITIESEPRDYKIGDFLNAVDELVCYFQAQDYQQADEEYAAALEMYAKTLRGTHSEPDKE